MGGKLGKCASGREGLSIYLDYGPLMDSVIVMGASNASALC